MMLKLVYISSRKLFQAQEYRELILPCRLLLLHSRLFGAWMYGVYVFFYFKFYWHCCYRYAFCLMHLTYV